MAESGRAKEWRHAERSHDIIELPAYALAVKSQLAYTRKGQPVDRNYDLFEILPDGSPIWKCAVAGHENAVQQLRELAAKTNNEVRIMHLPSQTVIAVLNVPAA
jgi:hypothetical protein